ncbi:MAG: hypothetical protein H7Z16_18495 [Pyrinomonadaceae bacterium]|nr:hypothetical protein [Pyrinomonadaceae bacterium]
MPKTSRKASRSTTKNRKTAKPRISDEFSSTIQNVTDEQLPPEWVHDLNVLRRVIKRTREINDPRIDVFSDKVTHGIQQFKIATISTNLDVKQLREVHERGYRVYLIEEKYRRKLSEEFLQYLRQAGEGGAQLVCYNELAYPTPLDGKGDVAFKNQVKKLVTKYKLSLIAGSYHDATKFYNLSPVIATHYRDGQPKAIPHAKMTSAVKAYELIRIPPNRHLRYYETEHGCFAVFICIDVYDPSMIFRLMMKNHLNSTEQKIDFVFVPSFTLKDAQELAEACRDLSYASATLVVYVNCAADTPRHVVYLAGEEVHEGNAAVKCELTKLSENVQILTIAADEYHRLRSKVSDGYSPVFNYLIGVRDGIRVEVKL